MLVFDFFDAADARSDDHADTVFVFRFEVQTAVIDRLNRRGQRHLREAVHPLGFAHTGVIFDIELFALAADFDGILRGIKGFDYGNRTARLAQALKEGFRGFGQRRYTAQSGNDNTTLCHGTPVS